MTELNLTDKTWFCTNGQQAIECAYKTVTEALKNLGD